MVRVTKDNTPALRFDGFDGEWNEQSLSSIADRVQTKNTKLASTLPLTISALHGLVDQITYFNNRVASSNLTNYLLIRKGEFAYNKSYSEGYPVGAVKRLDGYDKGVLSSLYVVFRLLSARDVDSDFVLSFFESSKWHRYVEMQSAEGARNHGLLNISADTFMGVPVSLAPSLEEQRAIGELFADLDALIEQHRAKHANLQQTKTALLQRMFPQDGADEPELRLGGFSGHWKRGSFGDAVEAFKYGVNAAATEYDGVTKYLRITDLDESSGQFGTGLVTSPRAEEETIRDFLLKEGDMVFARTGATVGRSYLFRKSVGRTVWAGFLIRARFNRNTDPQFVAAYAQTDSYWTYVKLTSQRSGQPGLNSAEYAAMPITTPPTLEEQRAIGEVFTNLDALIAAEHRYITQLAQAKTALLQRMFV